MKKSIKRIFSGLIGTAMLCTSLPVVYAEDTTADDVIFASGFEDDSDVSAFTGRGGVESISVTKDSAHTGEGSMLVSDRAKNWNGPQLLLDERCEAGVEYTVSAWVRTEWYNTVNLSMEYTDASGERHYSNLKSVVSQGDWVEIPETKLSFSEDMTNVYIYFECNDTANIYIDDFKLAKAFVHQIQQDIPSLKDVYSPYFKIGTAVTTSELAPQSTKDLIEKHFNSITLGNELKPESILDRNACIEAGNDNPQVNIASARTILNYCRDNNIDVRGHVLVWHSQTPDWFFKENYADDGDWVDKETMLKRMENYIKNVFATLEEEYPTVNFYAWDVVNEAWLDDGSARKPGGYNTNPNTSGWVQVFGDNSFIEPAFEYARKYAPEGCALYYNDYNEYWDHKRDAIYNMCKSLYQKGLLDGVGIQSHVPANATGFAGTESYIYAMKKYLSIGCDVQITELDISLENGKYSLQDQANKYKAIFQAAMDWNANPQSTGRVTAVCIWGPNDANSWLSSGSDALLYDKNNQPKLAYKTLTSMIPESEWGEGGSVGGTIEPDENGYYFHSTFEGDVDTWAGRGNADVLTSGRTAYAGKEALLVENRTSAWNGTTRSLNARAFIPGNEYSFSVNVSYFDGESTDKFYLKLQYEDADGETQYSTIAEGTGIAGEWIQLANTNYKIPSDASNMQLYVETAETTNNFYIDEAIGAVAGTVIKGAGQSTDIILGDITDDNVIDCFDIVLARRGLISGFASARQKIAADVDRSGKIEINDVLLMRKFVLRQITEFPDNTPITDNTAFKYNSALTYSKAPGEYMNVCSQAGTIKKETYNGINGSNNLNVYLPYGYDDNKQYNIFYLMHGGGENENTIFSDDVKLNNILDHMIMNGELEPMIVVTPTFNKCEARTFYKEFRESVIPFVEGKYSTYAKSTSAADIADSRMHRAYGGFSMGSASTWAVLVNSLDIVGYFMPLSGDNWEAEGGYNKAKSVADAVDKSGLNKDEYFIFAATGSDDIAYPNMNPQIEEMKKMDQFVYTSDFSKGNFYYLVADGKTHWWGYVRHYIYDALPYFFHG